MTFARSPRTTVNFLAYKNGEEGIRIQVGLAVADLPEVDAVSLADYIYSHYQKDVGTGE